MNSVCVRLTGSSCKADTTDRLIAMARIGVIKSEAIDGDTGEFEDFTKISYITDEVKNALQKLPPFESVMDCNLLP